MLQFISSRVIMIEEHFVFANNYTNNVLQYPQYPKYSQRN
jgi:hypothetical protein